MAVPAGPKFIMQQDYLLVDCLFLLTIRNRAVLGRRVLDEEEKVVNLEDIARDYKLFIYQYETFSFSFLSGDSLFFIL